MSKRKKNEPPKENKGTNKGRYRINDFTALKLGLTLNNSKRYRLKPKQIKEYLNLDQHKIKRLFYDIETSPMIAYTWRIGYDLNLNHTNIISDWKIICVSYKWEGSDKIYNLKWDKNQDDKELVRKFVNVLNQADEIVAHNGDRFDIKKIRTRAVLQGVQMKPKYRSLDTLKKAKAHFSFNSNGLNNLAKDLNVGEKMPHTGFQMWKDVLDGKKSALKMMCDYCNVDVIVLEDVYLAMQNYILHNTNVSTHNGGYKCACPNCGSEDIELVKNNFTALGTIKRDMGCKTCGYNYETSNSAYRTFIEHKNNTPLI
jgi:uncharacterized protein YprB with RNaseH-like and TPR domain